MGRMAVNKLFCALVALLLFLMAVAVIVRIGVLQSPEETLQGEPTVPSESTVSTEDVPVLGPEPTVPVETDPPETQPPVEKPITVAPDQPEVTMTATSAFALDTESRQVLYLDGNLDQRVYPASITKLLTAWVGLQYLDAEEVVTCGEEVTYVAKDSSRAFLAPGHKLKASMLVKGMLLPSGNDAAYALAVAAARKESGNPDLAPRQAVKHFMDLVNAAARDLGLSGTHFSTPDGYHADDHYTTFRDLMQIARLALEDPIISACCGLYEDEVTFESGQTITWCNTNQLVDPDKIYYHEQALGLKTGHTDAAGWCLLSAFRQEDGGILILGVFGCEDSLERFEDTLALYEAVSE